MTYTTTVSRVYRSGEQAPVSCDPYHYIIPHCLELGATPRYGEIRSLEVKMVAFLSTTQEKGCWRRMTSTAMLWLACGSKQTATPSCGGIRYTMERKAGFAYLMVGVASLRRMTYSTTHSQVGFGGQRKISFYQKHLIHSRYSDQFKQPTNS